MKDQNKSTSGAVVPPESVLQIIDAAVDLQQAGEVEKSIELLLDAQHRAPYYAPTHLLLGLAYRDAGRLEEAEARLRRAIELDPQQPEALQTLGLLLAQRRRPEEAIATLRQHLELVPDSVDTLRALVLELILAGRVEESTTLLEKAWRETRDIERGIDFTNSLSGTRQETRALEVLREASATAHTPEPWIEYGIRLSSVGRPNEALVPLSKAVELGPNSGWAWRSLADAQSMIGQYDVALQSCERALAIDQQDCLAWLHKSRVLADEEHFEEALEAARCGLRCIASDELSFHGARSGLQHAEMVALLGL